MRDQLSNSSAKPATLASKATAPGRVAAAIRRECLMNVLTTPVVVASGVFTVAQIVILSGTQTTLLGTTNAAVWLVLALLLPVAVISAALYRLYFKRQAEDDPRPTRLGPYLLLEEIGRGGMGTVYRAEHALMKRQCAIKLISSERADQTDMQRRFRQEARATAQLTHWNTIEVYDYGTSEDGRFYYVMEFLEGLNLHQFVHRFGPMQPGRVIYLVQQLCNALYEAENHGLVHRDIKPSNIFLTQRGESCDVVKLLDFGLVQTSTQASIRHEATDKKLHGSPAFMCPEQARGLNPDHRGDLYSLGAVAYFLLTGHPPFRDENPIMQVVSHATGDVPSFHDIGVAVPKQLAQIVMKCLQKAPEDRYGSARDLLIALERCSVPGAWSWQKAESWWARYQPVHSDKSGIETVDLAHTTDVDESRRETSMVSSIAECPSDTPTEIGLLPDDGDFD